MIAEHGAVQLFGAAEDCGHPEPDNDATPAWGDWDDGHPMGREGYRLCSLDPAGTGCPACTEAVADQEDLPEGVYVACRLPTIGAEFPPASS